MDDFDRFAFVRNRKDSVPPTATEMEKFDLYQTNVVISMSQDSDIPEFINKTNRLCFSKLPKRIQCLAFTSLNGKQLMGKWSLPKAEAKAESAGYIEKVMQVLGCSFSDADTMVKCGTVNKFDVDNAFESMFGEKKPIRRKRNVQ